MTIDANTFLLGLLGYPLGHTLSPRLHNAALAAAGLNGVYLALPTPPESLGDAVRGMRAWRLSGLNVTIPHKVAILPHLDGLTPGAEVVGAVNTLFWDGDRLMGDNTDVAGFKALCEGWEVTGKTVTVLGAGGSARAVGCALGQLGAREVHFVVRREGAAEELCDRLARSYGAIQFGAATWEGVDAVLTRSDLLVNTTPLGMEPHEAASPLTSEQVALLPDHAGVVDLIYRPAETLLMADARARGLSARNGLTMLTAQAQAAFERWTGVQVDRSIWQGALVEPGSA